MPEIIEPDPALITTSDLGARDTHWGALGLGSQNYIKIDGPEKLVSLALELELYFAPFSNKDGVCSFVSPAMV